MSEAFVGEIKLISWNFPPKGWAFCDGHLLPINQFTALFSILGTTYGGDGRTNFALPNLNGRAPVHMGAGFTLGQTGGEQAHTLTAPELPTHRHTLRGNSGDATEVAPGGATPAAVGNVTGDAIYAGSADVAMNPENVATAGGGQAHNNMQPYLVLNYVISLEGIFPSQN